ncbi:hypothetical protein FACS189438_1860 [Bacteroidia bacterium]|nr:hypothetical protein FACS189438_1860 [Bacteroidia bacterium]
MKGKERNFIFINPLLAIVTGMLATCLLLACSTGGGSGAGGNDLLGGGGDGGGGTTNSALVGKWTSISATGTVAYGNTQLGVSLANAVNSNMQTYNLTSVADLQFDANGKVSYFDMGTLHDEGTWSLNSNKLKLTNKQNQTLNMDIVLNGNQFTLNASGTEIAALVAWAIGDAVLNNNNYGGMAQTGLEVTVADLTIVFKK